MQSAFLTLIETLKFKFKTLEMDKKVFLSL